MSSEGTRATAVTGDSRTRIRSAALQLFAAQGVAATSLREIARQAGVAPGLVGHHFGGKDGLHCAIDDFVVGLFRDALVSVPLDGSVAEVATARDEAVGQMFTANPDAVDYLRRVIVTPDPGDEGLARKLVEETITQTQILRDHGIARSESPVTEQAVSVLMRQLGTRLLQPTLGRLWSISGAESQVPAVRVTLR